MEMFLNWLMVMVPQHYKFTWIIELYTYNEWILWDVNYTPIYLFFFLKNHTNGKW